MQNFDLENENGRSMIEMLGVLAIIGVLSVGGIAGYSKAMQKYRINKTIEQITLIAGNVRSFFAPQRSYEGLGYCNHNNDYCKLIKKAKLMPDEMWDDTDKQFNNVFGYQVRLDSAPKSTNTDNQAFSIEYLIEDNTEACIELASHDWSNLSANTIIRITPDDGTDYYARVPLNVDEAIKACTEPEVSDSLLGIYIDVDPSSSYWSKRLSDCAIANSSCDH